jgi:hypothetical protein
LVCHRTEAPKGKGKKPVNKDRFVSKMCKQQLGNSDASHATGDADVDAVCGVDAVLRGDSVVLGTFAPLDRMNLSNGSELTLTAFSLPVLRNV